MRGPLVPMVIALALSPTLAAANTLPAKPTKLGQCVACHGAEGHAGTPGVPRLAGQDEQYLASALRAYRGGQRQHPLMNSIANTLQPRDIQALASWYSRQSPVRR